jgi:hypothetical protein
MADNKTNMIALRLSPSQYAYVAAWAKQHGVSVSRSDSSFNSAHDSRCKGLIT